MFFCFSFFNILTQLPISQTPALFVVPHIYTSHTSASKTRRVRFQQESQKSKSIETPYHHTHQQQKLSVEMYGDVQERSSSYSGIPTPRSSVVTSSIGCDVRNEASQRNYERSFTVGQETANYMYLTVMDGMNYQGVGPLPFFCIMALCFYYMWFLIPFLELSTKMLHNFAGCLICYMLCTHGFVSFVNCD